MYSNKISYAITSAVCAFCCVDCCFANTFPCLYFVLPIIFGCCFFFRCRVDCHTYTFSHRSGKTNTRKTGKKPNNEKVDCWIEYIVECWLCFVCKNATKRVLLRWWSPMSLALSTVFGNQTRISTHMHRFHFFYESLLLLCWPIKRTSMLKWRNGDSSNSTHLHQRYVSHQNLDWWDARLVFFNVVELLLIWLVNVYRTYSHRDYDWEREREVAFSTRDIKFALVSLWLYRWL